MKGFEQDLAQTVNDLGNQWDMRDNIISQLKEKNDALTAEKRKKFDHKISMQLRENEAMMMIDGKTASYNNQLFQVGNAEQRDAFKSIVCFDLIKKGNEIEKTIMTLENDIKQLENNLIANKINTESIKEKAALIRAVIELDKAQTELAVEQSKVNILQIQHDNQVKIENMKHDLKQTELQSNLEAIKLDMEVADKKIKAMELKLEAEKIANATAELNLTAAKIKA